MPDYIGSSNDEDLITTRKIGDSFPRFAIEADGTIKTGDGTAKPSSGLYTTLGYSNGIDDTAKLNAILSNATGIVRGMPGEEYLLSSPLIIGSNTTLDMTGCTITLRSGYATNLLKNSTAGTASRNTDITIIGGTWDRGDNASDGTTGGAVGNAVGSHCLEFDGIDRLFIRDVIGLSDAGKYFIHGSDLVDFHISGIYGNVDSDGVHINGPAYDGIIERVFILTNDDTVTLLTNEGVTYQGYSNTSGPVKNVSINDVRSVSGQSMVKLAGSTDTLSDISIKGVSGTIGGQAGVILGAGDVTGNVMSNIAVRDIHVQGTAMTASVYALSSTITGTCFVENVSNLTATGSSVAVWLQATIESILLSNLRAVPSSVIACTDGTYGKIIVDSVDHETSNTSNIFGVFTTTVAPTIRELILRNCHRNGQAYTGFLTNPAAAARRIVLDHCSARQCLQAFRAAAGSGQTTAITMTGCQLEGVQWAQFTGPGNIDLYGEGNSLSNGIATTGSPVVRPLSLNMQLDVGATDVQAGNGRMAYNTNAARGCGVGPCVSNGTLWKNLYTGATT